MRKLVLAMSAMMLTATAAIADPIADRQALMKSTGKATGVLGAMAKGERPFDAAAVKDALETIAENSGKLDVAALFPVGSETGGDTTASPNIWKDMPGFQARADKFKEVAAAVLASAPADLAQLKTQLGTLGAACGGCHETFRIKKQ